MTHAVSLALLQFKPAKGDLRGNLARLTDAFSHMAALPTRPDVVTLPETALSGYFLEGGVRDVACSAQAFADAINDAFKASKLAGGAPVDIAAGFYELHDNTYYNSAIYATLGGTTGDVLHVHRKMFLPTYGLFDEERFVDHGLELRAFNTRWGRAALLVCEDVWHSIAATTMALDGAQIIFVPSASPARGAWPTPQGDVQGGEPDIVAPASLHRWERLARDQAEEHGIYMVVTQLVGNEGGKGFAGGSVVAGPKGDVRTRAPLWEEAILPVTLDLHDITRARADTPLLSDVRALLPHVLRSLQRTIAGDEV
jgi:predicted amidohydrolase